MTVKYEQGLGKEKPQNVICDLAEGKFGSKAFDQLAQNDIPKNVQALVDLQAESGSPDQLLDEISLHHQVEPPIVACIPQQLSQSFPKLSIEVFSTTFMDSTFRKENVGSSGIVDGGRWLVRTTTNPPLRTTTLHNNALMMSPRLVMKRLQSNCPAQRTSQRPPFIIVTIFAWANIHLPTLESSVDGCTADDGRVRSSYNNPELEQTTILETMPLCTWRAGLWMNKDVSQMDQPLAYQGNRTTLAWNAVSRDVVCRRVSQDGTHSVHRTHNLLPHRAYCPGARTE
ncbi:hypothetical protein T265_15603, partial [Opisthorchis viverrini]